MKPSVSGTPRTRGARGGSELEHRARVSATFSHPPFDLDSRPCQPRVGVTASGLTPSRGSVRAKEETGEKSAVNACYSLGITGEGDLWRIHVLKEVCEALRQARHCHQWREFRQPP